MRREKNGRGVGAPRQTENSCHPAKNRRFSGKNRGNRVRLKTEGEALSAIEHSGQY